MKAIEKLNEELRNFNEQNEAILALTMNGKIDEIVAKYIK